MNTGVFLINGVFYHGREKMNRPGKILNLRKGRAFTVLFGIIFSVLLFLVRSCQRLQHSRRQLLEASFFLGQAQSLFPKGRIKVGQLTSFEQALTLNDFRFWLPKMG
jgi:hypothetical protein